MNTLAIIGRLQKLLTTANIGRIDRVLELLTNPHSACYGAFWASFLALEAEKVAAYQALVELKALVREYGGLR